MPLRRRRGKASRRIEVLFDAPQARRPACKVATRLRWAVWRIPAGAIACRGSLCSARL